MSLTGPATASFLLRIGLAVEFCVFGYGKLVDAASWIGFISPWMMPLIPVSPAMFLTIVGIIEIALGVLLAAGIWTRVVALLVAFHLVGVLVALGYNDLAVRDFVALAAALALAALGHASCHWSVDGLRRAPQPLRP